LFPRPAISAQSPPLGKQGVVEDVVARYIVCLERAMEEAVVTLREVTAQTVGAICDLETRSDQARFVAPNAVSIAQAHFEPTARFRAIYADDDPVGFMMWRPSGKDGECYLWRFMIDRRYQGKGYGRAALLILLAQCRREGFRRMTLTFIPDEGGPGPFYVRLGFRDTGEGRPNGERFMELTL
jgi:diamine N-acetyltransferase